ncbi:ATP-binding cassette domain-containing protein [Nonomuraea typhae]|uniref:ATP-binding cassette domain-containing protein n=1 Tax=Nonomuraea typhae TaxID=2603600 RepID=UPI0012FA8F59|nr:ATP-binding cassette domain-containing protein [Nonomuraea typhae]
MAAIVIENLRKTYGRTTALAGFDLTVPEGAVLGLLGPNGAGKTTVVRILATLLRADSGRAEVLGVDVAAGPQRVRGLIGLTGQYAAVDELLTGRENLLLIGRLFRSPPAEVRRRAPELLEMFELAEAADRQVRTYSGGMRRRLDLAASLMTRPRVLFLDEPTTGLDPRSRRALWNVIERLPQDGTTVLLTTQYLEEADRLAGSITIIDHGRAIAEGTPDEIKALAGGARAEVVLAAPADAEKAAGVMGRHGDGPPDVDHDTVTVTVKEGFATVPGILRDLDAAGVRVADLALRRPSLDDAFLALTGHTTSGEGAR